MRAEMERGVVAERRFAFRRTSPCRSPSEKSGTGTHRHPTIHCRMLTWVAGSERGPVPGTETFQLAGFQTDPDSGAPCNECHFKGRPALGGLAWRGGAPPIVAPTGLNPLAPNRHPSPQRLAG